jgi:hypothetical protein
MGTKPIPFTVISLPLGSNVFLIKGNVFEVE